MNDFSKHIVLINVIGSEEEVFTSIAAGLDTNFGSILGQGNGRGYYDSVGNILDTAINVIGSEAHPSEEEVSTSITADIEANIGLPPVSDVL